MPGHDWGHSPFLQLWVRKPEGDTLGIYSISHTLKFLLVFELEDKDHQNSSQEWESSLITTWHPHSEAFLYLVFYTESNEEMGIIMLFLLIKIM